MSSLATSGLIFPFAEPPEPGSLAEVAPGVLWLRLALPFALDHVNVYLIEDGPGWAVLDTGLGDAATRAVWERLLASDLRGRPLTRVLCTHFHPDHVGQAGWLCEAASAELWMTRTEYLVTSAMQAGASLGDGASPGYRRFFRRHGLAEPAVQSLVQRGHAYLKLTTGIPDSYRRIAAGDRIGIGGRRFEVFTGGGHAPEQAMLFARADRLFFPADQVLARISPNVSVWAWEPEADPLRDYLRSLAALRDVVPDDVLVLPAHNLPFVGLPERAAELERHHDERCARVADACAEPRSAADLIAFLFPRALDPHQTSFAFGETLAHVNYMLGRGELEAEDGIDGVLRVRAA